MIVSAEERQNTVEAIINFFGAKQALQDAPEADTNEKAPKQLDFCYRDCRGPAHTLP